jgi:hypothetical protein
VSRYGRFHLAEAASNLPFFHHHKGEPLKEVDWEPKNAVLDQQDLLAQSIRCSTFIPGAQDVNALGSCTANATVSALSNVLEPVEYIAWAQVGAMDDTVGLEEAAIRFYHACTDQTGTPDQEWPPTDCGSSGQYVVKECQAQKLISGQKIAHGGQNLVSLLQGGGVLQGTPFFNSWEQPDAQGFVDGDGGVDDLVEAIRSGVAGGHETYVSAVEKLTIDAVGRVDGDKTVLRVRNSWSSNWGDHGSFRIHLSTLEMLGSYCDFRQLVR